MDLAKNEMTLIHKGLYGHTYRCQLGDRHYAFKASGGHPSHGRDQAGYILSQAFGFNIVPFTQEYSCSLGRGLLKDWVIGFPPKNLEAVPIDLRTKCGLLHLISGDCDGFLNNILVTEHELWLFDFGHAFSTEQHCVRDDFATKLGVDQAFYRTLPYNLDVDLSKLEVQLLAVLPQPEVAATLDRIVAVQCADNFHSVFRQYQKKPPPNYPRIRKTR